MKALIGLYLVIGVVLLGVGFLFSGPCPDRNTDAVSNLVFVLTWPVGLYAEVYHGPYALREWLHAQACAGGDGLGPKKSDSAIRSLLRYPEERGARDGVAAAPVPLTRSSVIGSTASGFTYKSA